MARDDYFVIAAKVLDYLYKCIKKGIIPDPELLSPEAQMCIRDRVRPVDKEILEQYIDACALVDEAKKELDRLKRQRKRIEQDIVKGSSPEFPYCLLYTSKKYFPI